MASQELYTLIVGEKFVSFSSPLGPSFLNLTLAHPQTEHVESSMGKWQDLFGLLHALFFYCISGRIGKKIDLSGKLDLRTVSNQYREGRKGVALWMFSSILWQTCKVLWAGWSLAAISFKTQWEILISENRWHHELVNPKKCLLFLDMNWSGTSYKL